MWGFSLTFHSHQQEAGFLQHSAGKLLSGITCCAICMLLDLSLWLMHMWFDGVAWRQHHESSWRWLLVSLAMMWLMSLVVLVVARSPTLHRRIGLVQREVAVTVLAVLCLVQTVMGTAWYIARVVGFEFCQQRAGSGLCRYTENWSGNQAGNDYNESEVNLLLQLAIVLMATHFVLPIRWISVVFVEVTVLLLYTIGVCVLGSGHQDPFGRLIRLTVFTLLTAHGKRQLERAERMFFLQFLAERQLRAEAEFQLAQTHTDVPRPEETGSGATSAVGHIVQTMADQPQLLESLAEIGRREEWLVDAAHLSIDSGEALLGVGGFGILVAGRFRMTPAAIKFVKQNAGRSSLADMGNELRVLRKLRHPNIILFHGVSVNFQQGGIVVVLERAFGRSLDAFVSQYHAEANKTIRCVFGLFQVLLGVCRALVYLHERLPPIVHGDLKGGNIIVEQRGPGPHAKLLDFGLARVLSRQAQPLGGTLRWAAPEVFHKGEPTVAADVFSFGRVIYFVFVGKKPLDDIDKKTIQKAAAKNVVIPLAWPPESPPEMLWCRQMVEETTQPNPKDRLLARQMCIEVESAALRIWSGLPLPYEQVDCGQSAAEDHESRGRAVPLKTQEVDVGGASAMQDASSNCASEFWERVHEFRQDVEINGQLPLCPGNPTVGVAEPRDDPKVLVAEPCRNVPLKEAL